MRRKLLRTAYKERLGRGGWGEEVRQDGRGRGERVSAVFFLVHGDE